MDLTYVITPFLAWFLAGTLKFLINSVRINQLAFGQIGYGGLPSNHSSIVSCMAALVAFKEGLDHPAFGVAVTLAFVVILDANSLRRQVGRQAEAINTLFSGDPGHRVLRERIGHSPLEIVSGVFLGIVIAFAVHIISL
ncbi:MAG: divergent PAP2 family protein [Paracoccaceae bacterium]